MGRNALRPLRREGETIELVFSIFIDHIAVDPFLNRQCKANFEGDGLFMALQAADRGYVMETGSVIMQDQADRLLQNPEIQRAYLGKGKKEIWDA